MNRARKQLTELISNLNRGTFAAFRTGRWRAIVLVIGVCTCATVSGEEDKKDPHVVTVCKAYETTIAALRSATGRGEYEEWHKLGEIEAEKARTKATVQFAWEGNKYLLDMAHTLDALGTRRTTIMYDGTDLYRTMFGERIRPVGAESMIFSGKPNHKGLVPATMAGFQWDISKLPQTMLDVPKILEGAVPGTTKATVNKEGDIAVEATITDGRVAIKLEFPKKYAFNVHKYEWGGVGKPAASRFTTRWAKVADVWTITELEQTRKVPGGSVRFRLAINEVQVNPAIPDGTFTKEALGAPLKARTIDQRPGIPLERRVIRPPMMGE